MINVTIAENKINSGELDGIFLKLYGESENSKKRYLDIIKKYKENFGDDKEIEIFSAPGRTEIIGNHTDHQRGKAIAASVNLDIVGIVSLNSDNCIRVISEGFNGTDEVNLDEINPKKEEYNTSKALIRGCAAKLGELGYSIKGFDMYTQSNVLKGSGLSSSAAFEVLVATVMNSLFCDGKEDAVSLAKIGKYAENVYFGKPCGMLDQTASSVGGFVYIDFENKENPKIDKNEFNLSEYGYSLCVVDTGGNHAALTDEYASVSRDMHAVCELFGKEALSEVNEEEFYNSIAEIKNKISERAILRASHLFDENKRVEEFKKALENKSFEDMMKLVKSSGNSSFKYLQNVFSISDIDSQGLTLALYMSERILGEKGAVRVHGGGFAGTIQAYVPEDMTEFYIKEIEKIFGKGKCYKLSIRPCGGIKVM